MMCVCMYTHIYTCAHMCAYIYMCVYTYIYRVSVHLLTGS